METSRSSSLRRPWLAALASLFCTGLGHAYAGRLVRGLVFFFLVLLLPPAVALLSHLEPSHGVLVAIVALPFLHLLLVLVAIFDAWRVARRAPRPYPPGDANRAAFYALFLIVGMVYPALAWLHVKARHLEAFRIPTASMSPTLVLGDRILVQKLDAGDAAWKRGDLVVFVAPGTEGTHYIKRVIGLPGDRLTVSDREVLLDGKPLRRGESEGAAGHATFEEGVGARSWRVWVAPALASSEPVEVEVPKGHVYVLGDNRPHSLDSRRLGPIRLGDLVGRADYVFWPGDAWERFGVLR